MQIYKTLRVYNFPKNFLIFLPIIISGEYQIINDYKKIIIDLISLFLITSLIYLTNDYTDQKIDKINKIKKNNLFLSKEQFYLHFYLILILTLLFIYFTGVFKNYAIYLYIFNFCLYNFFFKYIKYLDILFLINFYFIRIIYGSVSYDLNLSIGFIIFIYSLFFILSIYKRKIQVEINKIKEKSDIIAYTLKDISLINKSIFFALTVNLITFIFFNINFFVKHHFLNNFFMITDLAIFNVVIFFIIYILNFFRLFYSFLNNLIQTDIYIFFLKDKYFHISLLVLCLSLIL